MEERESALWPEYLVSVRSPYRDEPKDEVEASDRRAVFRADNEDESPTACLKYACPMKACICNICLLSEERPKLKKSKPTNSASDVTEARFDAFLSAPKERGVRATEIARISPDTIPL